MCNIPNHGPLDALQPGQLPIEVLDDRCGEQRKRFEKSGAKVRDSEYCDEIVRRACQGDQEALGVLLKIAGQSASRYSPVREGSQDFQQDVVLPDQASLEADPC